MKNSERPSFPYFCHSGQRDIRLEEFNEEVEKWLLLLPGVASPRLTGQMLADVVQRKSATAGSLHARVLVKVEDVGIWPDGLLDAYISMIPKTDGDATPLGQRSPSVLPVIYRIWASARMGHLKDWFRSCVPDSVFSAGGGRGSVEAWYATAFDVAEVLTGAADSDVHLFVADVIKSFDTVDGRVEEGGEGGGVG